MKIIDFIEHDDGSATILCDLSPEEVIAFAKIGLQHAMIEAATRVIDDGKIATQDPHCGGNDGGER